jgi:hypothetical protein
VYPTVVATTPRKRRNAASTPLKQPAATVAFSCPGRGSIRPEPTVAACEPLIRRASRHSVHAAGTAARITVHAFNLHFTMTPAAL